ncbi:MAG TPA: hypothetical protein VHF88_07485 [Thermoleophilaceae bacterium]|nr:hypothetical protein [Thermoleophilaceae bacterium]
MNELSRYRDSLPPVWAVPELGLCQLTKPSPAIDSVLSSYYEDPEHADAGGYIDALISHVLRSPRLSYDEVRDLADPVRAELRVACAVYAGVGLPPERLTDRRLLVAMAERFRRQASQPSDGGFLGFFRSLQGLGEHAAAQLHHRLRGVPFEVAAQAVADAFEDFRKDQERKLDEVRRQPLFFIVADLPVSDARWLLFEAPENIATLVRETVMTDPTFLDNVERAVLDAPHLDEPQRDDLLKGLKAVRNGDPYACRHLLAGVEGGLWLAAEDEGVIDSNRLLLRSKKKNEPFARNFGRFLDTDDGGLDVGDDYSWFLRRAAYDEQGQAIRHGRARIGHADYSVWSFVALLGWLDRFSGTTFMYEVTDRFMMEPDETETEMVGQEPR